MAQCLITESIGQKRQQQDGAQHMPVMNPGVTQLVTYFGSTQSAAFSDSTSLIRVIADAEVYLAFGSNPTATTTAIRVPANTIEYFGVYPGERVACYDGVT